MHIFSRYVSWVNRSFAPRERAIVLALSFVGEPLVLASVAIALARHFA